MRQVLTIAYIVFATAACSFGQCQAPHYRKGRDYSNRKLGIGSMYLAISRSDFSLDKLICLGEALKARHREWKSSEVLIFDSYDDAISFHDPGQNCSKDCKKAAADLHIDYSFDREAHKDQLDILPFGWNTDPSLVTTIDLRISAPFHCRVEIDGRCVFAAETLGYPDEALKTGISGAVTLAGTITREGRVVGIHTVNVESNGQGKPLADAALNNLATWQLDSAQREGAVRVVYSYTILDRSAPAEQAHTGFELPDKLLIRARRPN